jgi:hypothetical protein
MTQDLDKIALHQYPCRKAQAAASDATATSTNCVRKWRNWRRVGSATGKEMQGLFAFSVLMRKHLAPQQLARYPDFHFAINSERF